MIKHLLPLFVFVFPLTLFGEDELPKETLKPAIETYRHVQRNPYIQRPEGIDGMYRKFTVSPQTLPDPLLHYRLHVFATEKESGNALPLYIAALKRYRELYAAATEKMYQSDEYRQLDPADKEYSLKRSRLLFKAFPLWTNWPHRGDAPVITSEEETKLHKSLNDVFLLMEKASKKSYMDWSDIYEYRGIATDLEPLQQARIIARYLADKANWEIRNGKHEEAVKTLRVGFAFADHILESTPPSFLVGLLIGLSCKALIYEQLHFLSAQPGVPNLYPALMQMTPAHKSWASAIQSETLLLMPKYHDEKFWASADSFSPEQAKSHLDEFIMFHADIINRNNKEGASDNVSLIRTAMHLTAYPPAKKRLLNKGFSEKEINALTTDQVILPFVLEELKRAYDLMLVNASMPMGESHTAINFQEYLERKEKGLHHLADYLLAIYAPAVDSAKSTYYQSQQTLDVLKIVESLRYYAAIHDGQLPKSLDEITELAVPKICPMTAKPYEYHSDGKTATIDYVLGHYRGKCRIEITIDPTPPPKLPKAETPNPESVDRGNVWMMRSLAN